MSRNKRAWLSLAALLVSLIGFVGVSAAPASAGIPGCHLSTVSGASGWSAPFYQWSDVSHSYLYVRASPRLETGTSGSACANIYAWDATTGPSYDPPCNEITFTVQLQVGSVYGGPGPFVGGPTGVDGIGGLPAENSDPGNSRGYRVLVLDSQQQVMGVWGGPCYSPTARFYD